MGQIMLDINAFTNSSATHAPSRSPETALYVLSLDPLIDAVQHNNLDRAAALLVGGANPNCTARGGITALHSAASQGNAEMIKLLTDHGANLNAMTDKRESVLLFAVRGRDHPGSTAVLAHADHNHPISPHHSDEDAVRTLKALFGSPTRWIHLLRSLDKVDQDGVSPLMLAVENGFEKTATMLLKRGARPDVRDHANHTALWYAARNNHRNLVRLLLLADPAVSADRDLSHILKLASKNFTAGATTTDHGRGEDGQAGWWGISHTSASALIAEEMVRVCRDMGVMDGLLRLAEQRRKGNVVELLLDAMGRLDTSQSCEAGGS
jgi:ankyrin repeat protein